jgi:hypothetical protein
MLTDREPASAEGAVEARSMTACTSGRSFSPVANRAQVHRPAQGEAYGRHLPRVQVPPRGVWGGGGQARYATLESWTGREPGTAAGGRYDGLGASRRLGG